MLLDSRNIFDVTAHYSLKSGAQIIDGFVLPEINDRLLIVYAVDLANKLAHVAPDVGEQLEDALSEPLAMRHALWVRIEDLEEMTDGETDFESAALQRRDAYRGGVPLVDTLAATPHVPPLAPHRRRATRRPA